MKFSIVIPAYNEEKNIRKSLAKVFDYLEEKDFKGEVIVVDDGSGDNTVSEVREFYGGREDLKLLEKPHRGKGFAVRDGVLAASGDYILFSDADLATPIEDADRLLMWLRDHDFSVAVASRQGFGAKRVDEPGYRHIIGRVFNFIIKLVALPGIEDTQCGFKMFTGEAADKIFSSLRVYGDTDKEISQPFYGAFDVELLYLAKKFGYKIKEVPVTWKHVETARFNFVYNAWRMFWDVIRVRINDIRGLYSN